MTTPDAGQRLIEDLRECAADLSAQYGDDPETTLAWKAADEIERLRGVEYRYAWLQEHLHSACFDYQTADEETITALIFDVSGHSISANLDKTIDAAIAASRSTGAADVGDDHG